KKRERAKCAEAQQIWALRFRSRRRLTAQAPLHAPQPCPVPERELQSEISKCHGDNASTSTSPFRAYTAGLTPELRSVVCVCAHISVCVCVCVCVSVCLCEETFRCVDI